MFQLLLAVIYLVFIGLGLPDSMLGSAWPVMFREFDVPVSYAGIVSMIIALGTIVSSLQSDRLTKKMGPGKVTAISVGLSAISLLGFSFCQEFWQLCILAIPYGLAAGSVDASVNNYVALHYSASHMSWLHCMWGVGASTGPYVMGHVLTAGAPWNNGYRCISICLFIIFATVVVSLPLWKGRNTGEGGTTVESKALSLSEIIRISGAKEVMVAFFCYCAIEQTAMLWGSSYLVFNRGLHKDMAATWGGLFVLGVTIGRGLSGFVAMKLKDSQMIRLGQTIIAAGALILMLPLGRWGALVALIMIGLGCAPVYPCIIHATPTYFGAENSQALVGVQMASAYVGTCLMPPIFGTLADIFDVSLLPFFLMALLLLMVVMHEKLLKKKSK